jgi:hypothetical protein
LRNWVAAAGAWVARVLPRLTKPAAGLISAAAVLSPAHRVCSTPLTEPPIAAAAAAVAVMTGSLVLSATRFATRVGNGTPNSSVPRSDVRRAFVVAMVCGVASWVLTAGQHTLSRPWFEIGPFTLIALSAVAGLASGPAGAVLERLVRSARTSLFA